MTHRLLHILTVLITAFVICTSCVKNDEESIPSYISVDTSYLVSQSGFSGSPSHRISDVWLYVDEQLIGAYETPVDIPVLADGPVDIRMKAGIMVNGISDSRTAYEFYKPFETSLTLVRDSVIILNPQYTYKDNVTFKWIEDFEDFQSSFSRQRTSDTTMNITTDVSEVFEGNASAKIVLDTNAGVDFFEFVSDTNYILPQDGSSVVLEMNYKTESVLTVGIFAYEPFANQVSILNLNPTDEWKKVYVYLTTAITTYLNADYYTIFIGGYPDEGQEESVILIDNIKLLY